MKNKDFKIKLRNPFFEDLFPLDPFKNIRFNKWINQGLPTDIKEHEDHFEMIVNVPGISKEDVEITLENGYLTIKAEENKETKDEDDDSYVRRERYYRSSCRSFYVGDNIEEKDISAKLENGVLTLAIPKVTEKQVKKQTINIK
jgi:HSP20 family protein